MLAHIVRIDSSKTHGWQVRFNPAKKGTSQYKSKLFSDSVHGGKRKAKKLAEEFLKSELAGAGMRTDIPVGRRIGMQFPESPKRTNSANLSGRNGVYRGEHVARRGDRTQEVKYWAASYSIGPDGTATNRSKRFYFGTVRTEKEARRLAMRFREGWEEAFLSGGTRAVVRFFRSWSTPAARPQRKAGAARAR